MMAFSLKLDKSIRFELIFNAKSEELDIQTRLKFCNLIIVPALIPHFEISNI